MLTMATQSQHRYECSHARAEKHRSLGMQVLKWIVDRCRGRVGADKTPLGWMPDPSDIDLEGLEYEKAKLVEALKIDVEDWKKEVLAQDELFIKLHGDLPMEMHFQRELLISRL